MPRERLEPAENEGRTAETGLAIHIDTDVFEILSWASDSDAAPRRGD